MSQRFLLRGDLLIQPALSLDAGLQRLYFASERGDLPVKLRELRAHGLLGLLCCRIRQQSGEPSLERARHFVHAALLRGGGPACFLGLGLCAFVGALGALDVILRRCVCGEQGGAGMLNGAADGAGEAGAQCPGDDARLCV